MNNIHQTIIGIIVRSFDTVGMSMNRNTYELLNIIGGCSLAYVTYILSQYPSYTYNQISSIVKAMNDEQINFISNQARKIASKSDDIKSCVTTKGISWLLYPSKRKEDYLKLKRMLEKTDLNIKIYKELIEESLTELSDNLLRIFAFKILNFRVKEGDNFGDIINTYINNKLIESSENNKLIESSVNNKLIESSVNNKLIESSENNKLALLEEDDDVKNNEIQKYTEQIFDIQQHVDLVYKDKDVDKYITQLPESACGVVFKQVNAEINQNVFHSAQNIAQEINHNLERFKHRLDTDFETLSLTIYITISLFLIIIANKMFYTYLAGRRRRDGKRKSRKSRNRKSNKRKSKRSFKRRKSKRSSKRRKSKRSSKRSFKRKSKRSIKK